MNKIYYVYKHTRIDTNEVFYIGIGTKNKKGKYKCKQYPRAYAKGVKRSEFWKNVYNSCNKNIQIEILFEYENLELCKAKEKELIKFYGRRDLGLGTLVNLTDGADGNFNLKWSEERRLLQKEKIKEFYKNNKSKLIGIKRSDNFKEKQRQISKKRVFSEKTRQKIGKVHKGKTISDNAKKLMSQAKIGKAQSLENKKKRAIKMMKNKIYKIQQLDMDNNIIKIWDYLFQIKDELGINKSRIHECLSKKKDSYLNFKWIKVYV